MPEKKPKILCLDDQPENLRLRMMFLEQFGCEVTIVTNAHACLEAATRESFDLALLDYHLAEDVTGEDVAHDLRSCAQGMPLVMLTGDPKIPESAQQSVDAVFIKGVGSPAEMLDMIQKLLPDCGLKPRRKPISREALLRTAARK